MIYYYICIKAVVAQGPKCATVYATVVGTISTQGNERPEIKKVLHRRRNLGPIQGQTVFWSELLMTPSFFEANLTLLCR